MPRRRAVLEELDYLQMLTPRRNPRAVTAYRCCLLGLIPFVGMVLGFVAIILGVLGWRHARFHPDDQGMLHSVVGIVVGSLELLTNWVGFLLILSALGVAR